MLLPYVKYPAHAGGGVRNYARLGVQTSPNDVFSKVLAMAITWSPKKAKSFDVYNFYHSDYHGNEVNAPTGYASFRVRYYSTAEEGRFKVVRTMIVDDPYNGGTQEVEVSPYYVRGGKLPIEVYT